MLSIEDFIALVRKEGFQRPNRFQINLNIPKSVKEQLTGVIDELQKSPLAKSVNRLSTADASTIERTISLMASDVSAPGFNVTSTDMHVGQLRKIANEKTNGDLAITFRCSGNMNERKLFDAWRKFMFRSNHTVAFYDDYISPMIKILMLDTEGNVTYESSVSEAYPATVTEIALSRDQNDSIMTFQVTFNYRKFYNSDEDFGEKRRSYPPAYGGDVVIPAPNFVLDASGLPEAPRGSFDFPPLALPIAPPTNNQELFLIDVYRNIERVKRRIEDGSLETALGAKIITDIVRDVDVGRLSQASTVKLLNYSNQLSEILERY